MLAGCSKAEKSAFSSNSKPEAASAVDVKAADGKQPIAVTLPRIAYIYELGFRIAGHDMATLQQLHADACVRLGPTQCQIIAMRQESGAGTGGGELDLAVVAPRARSFTADLGRLAGERGGEQVSSSLIGEDLSKKIVDTDARIKARTLMRDRLMQVLATRQGKVSELVEAEKAVADANEDIDTARSELADMQGRVDFSQVKIAYHDGASTGLFAPVREAFGDVGGLIGYTIAGLVRLLAAMLPLLALALAARGVWRRFPSRARRQRDDGPPRR
jgi:hypothetical protein